MNADEHYKNGQFKVNQNQLHEAIVHFTKAISLDAKNPFYYIERSVCYLNMEQFELALTDMDMSVKIDPEYAYFYSLRGFLKIKMKDIEGGIKDYEKSLELDPKNEITYNNLGMALEQVGNIKRAQKVFQEGNKILGYDPTKRETKVTENKLKESETGNIALNDKKESKSGTSIAKDVFSKKSTFKEFIEFIKNGFKLDKDEES